MTEWKSFLESRTVWANLVGLLALVLSGLGFKTSDINAEYFVDVVLQVVAGISFLASTVFRITATRKITL